jgi:hypothetical protein
MACCTSTIFARLLWLVRLVMQGLPSHVLSSHTLLAVRSSQGLTMQTLDSLRLGCTCLFKCCFVTSRVLGPYLISSSLLEQLAQVKVRDRLSKFEGVSFCKWNDSGVTGDWFAMLRDQPLLHKGCACS